MAKIIHTGDLHLDSPFTSLSNEDAKARRASLRDVFSKIIDIANSESVDILILAGDVFDAPSLRPETASSLLRDLARAKCRVFITPGNHDPLTPTSPYATLEFPENVHIFKENKLTAVEIHELGLRIFGAAYTSERYDERILEGFKVPDDELANIVILHSNLNADGYSPVTSAEIAECGADYVALGHVHKPTDIEKAGDTYYAYCGCPESRDFGESYDTAIYIGEVEKGRVNLSRRKVSDIAHKWLTVDFEEIETLLSAAASAKQEFLRLTVTGECEKLDTEALTAKLLARYKEVEIIDHTEEPRNIWDGIEDEGLRGLFLRKMKALLDKAETDEEKRKINLAARMGIDAIENREM